MTATPIMTQTMTKMRFSIQFAILGCGERAWWNKWVTMVLFLIYVSISKFIENSRYKFTTQITLWYLLDNRLIVKVVNCSREGYYFLAPSICRTSNNESIQLPVPKRASSMPLRKSSPPANSLKVSSQYYNGIKFLSHRFKWYLQCSSIPEYVMFSHLQN